MKYYKTINLNENFKINNHENRKKKFKRNIKIFFFLILFCIIYFFIKVKNKYYSSYNTKVKIENTKINNKFKNELPNELYPFTKKPKISILIPHFDEINIEKNVWNINMIKSLLNQTLKDLELLISFKKINTTLFYQIKHYYKKYKNIKIFEEETDIFNSTINLIMNSEAKYISVLKRHEYFKNPLFFENIYNETFGKTNNIYEYKIEKEINYLIKSKILKDIIDDEILFNDFIKLEKYILLIPTVNINYISISYSIDNKYIIYAYVSMISVLESKNYNTYISFFVIVSNNFTIENKNIILSLYEQYDFLNITFIYMDNRYKNVKIINYLNQNAYFRLSLGELLPNLNKIIYLDCDVIVYKDLTNLYNINFDKNIMLSLKRPYENNEISKINSGVLLMNLKKMRTIKFEDNILNIINKGFVSVVQDQALLIKYYINQIGYLNEQYNVLVEGFGQLIKIKIFFFPSIFKYIKIIKNNNKYF